MKLICPCNANMWLAWTKIQKTRRHGVLSIPSFKRDSGLKTADTSCEEHNVKQMDISGMQSWRSWGIYNGKLEVIENDEVLSEICPAWKGTKGKEKRKGKTKWNNGRVWNQDPILSHVAWKTSKTQSQVLASIKQPTLKLQFRLKIKHASQKNKCTSRHHQKANRNSGCAVGQGILFQSHRDRTCANKPNTLRVVQQVKEVKSGGRHFPQLTSQFSVQQKQCSPDISCSTNGQIHDYI